MFDIPEGGLNGLTDEELSALLNEGIDAFRGLGLGDESAEEDIAEGERIVPLITQIRDEQKARSEVVDARRARARALLDSDVDAEEEQTDDGGEPQVIDEAPPVVEDAVPEPVAASARKASPVRKAAAKSVEIRTPANRVVVTAAADVPGYGNGQELDGLAAAGDALVARMRGIPNRNLGNVRHRYGGAVLRKEGFGDLVQADHRDDMSLVAAATREKRLPGGSLVAAGGWCAPSETLYDLCVTEAVDGIVSLPEFQVNRGGIRYTEGPDFSTIYAACGFHQTEAQAIAGDCKDCCEPDCPAFTEIRLDAIGICIKAPILTQAAYPELVRRYIEGALVAHQHKVNAYLLSVMSAAAGTPITSPYVKDGSTILTLNALEVQAAAIRQKYRMAQDASLEVIAPIWLKHFIRIDLTARTGVPWTGDPVSDAQIDGWFSTRHMSVQWVYDWQEMVITGSTPTLPVSVNVLMYPAGTWAKGTTDVINLDAVYDSVGLEANTYTALFVEEGILAVQKCTETVAVTLPICSSGRTGAADLDNCFGVVAP